MYALKTRKHVYVHRNHTYKKITFVLTHTFMCTGYQTNNTYMLHTRLCAQESNKQQHTYMLHTHVYMHRNHSQDTMYTQNKHTFYIHMYMSTEIIHKQQQHKQLYIKDYVFKNQTNNNT